MITSYKKYMSLHDASTPSGNIAISSSGINVIAPFACSWIHQMIFTNLYHCKLTCCTAASRCPSSIKHRRRPLSISETSEKEILFSCFSAAEIDFDLFNFEFSFTIIDVSFSDSFFRIKSFDRMYSLLFISKPYSK